MENEERMFEITVISILVVSTIVGMLGFLHVWLKHYIIPGFDSKLVAALYVGLTIVIALNGFMTLRRREDLYSIVCVCCLCWFIVSVLLHYKPFIAFSLGCLIGLLIVTAIGYLLEEKKE